MNKDEKIDKKSKIEDLEEFREYPEGKGLTTDQGVKVNHTDDSLKAGKRGPTLMEDFHFREKITHFDHERIPERIVHARGAGAHGYFECYESMSEYTMAKFLQEPGKKTPVFVRFSTVAGFRGSADTARDVRGFATKFYTEDGNYDIVGNNIPIFFIQDAIKFPDLIHSVKPEPDNEIPQASTAHDTFYDFVVSAPETTHMIMWALSDRAIPRSYRMMEGFSVNTFRFVNSEGKGRFIKFIWKPLLGVHSLVWDESMKLGGEDPDYHRRDLYDAIDNGDYPEYELYVQMIEEEDEHNFDFDILDPTKHWPEELIPPKKIGKLVLNRKPDNFFAEVEQVAFCPGNVVPGIDFSNDPLLQGRLFSYIDTQLIRLGGPNFHEIPINRPLAPVHNNQRDGYHRHTINTGKTSYFPNTLGDNCPKPVPKEDGGYVHYMEKVEGKKIRDRSDKFKDFYSQARSFYNSMSEPEKQHIISAFHFEVGKVESKEVRQKMVDQFANVDKGLAVAIAKGVGVSPPSDGADSSNADNFPSFSMENTVKNTVKTRKVAILAENGFNYDELVNVKDALKDAGANSEIISMYLGMIKADNGQEIEVDRNYISTASTQFDAVYVPGGKESVDTLKKRGDVIHFVNEAFKHCKAIAAVSEGVDLLTKSDITGFSISKGEITSDKGVVTTIDNTQIKNFAKSFIDAIAMHRHWNRETK
ncbi:MULTISPECIES: catalase [Methanobacterium]|uniref:Catalase n=1 Tax=Methanobacterium bryantii TaxID=2161 RepID=A0A2A2H905_METBR|nr:MULTISPECIES: catalase [Methanobacterium]OEC88911.1 catalase HPII [Methanobacterium sp. A39]PAV05825.1 catalase [Methanobacterium bryantii]